MIVIEKALGALFAIWYQWQERKARRTLAAWERYDKQGRLKPRDAWGHEIDITREGTLFANSEFLKRTDEEDNLGLFAQIRRSQEERRRQAEEKMKRSASTFYASKEWRKLRYQAFKRYGNTCCVCGRGPKNGLVMHVDHIKPRSYYPQLALEITNLQIMCEECNVSKSNKDNIQWR